MAAYKLQLLTTSTLIHTQLNVQIRARHILSLPRFLGGLLHHWHEFVLVAALLVYMCCHKFSWAGPLFRSLSEVIAQEERCYLAHVLGPRLRIPREPTNRSGESSYTSAPNFSQRHTVLTTHRP